MKTGPKSVLYDENNVPLTGQKIATGSIPVIIASDQTVVPISDNGGSLTVDGTVTIVPSGTQTISGSVTANAGTNLNTSALALDASVIAQTLVDNATFTDGTTRVNPSGFVFDEVAGPALTENDVGAARIDSKRAQILVIEDATTRGTRATIKAATTAAVAADPALVVAISPNNSISVTMGSGSFGGQIEGRAADGTSLVGNPVLIGGTDGANAQTILTDTSGRIVIAPAGAVSSTSGFIFGTVSLTIITSAAIRKTTYTEQTSNAQRSVVSSSASDTSAGTGARQIKITYLDSTGAGPFTETIALNGTSAVNTVGTNICYIEKMDIVTVGSGGSNAGIVSLKASPAGGGVTIGSIAINDNKTVWAMHYVPTGKICYITSQAANTDSNSTAVGGGFIIKSQILNVSNVPDVNISDNVRVVGQSNTVIRSYGTPIQIAGPARIQAWVTTENASTVEYRSSYDLYEQ